MGTHTCACMFVSEAGSGAACVSAHVCPYVLGFLDRRVCVCVFFFFYVGDMREPLLLSGLRGMPSLQLHSPRKLSQTV